MQVDLSNKNAYPHPYSDYKKINHNTCKNETAKPTVYGKANVCKHKVL